MNTQDVLIRELVKLLNGGSAHAGLDDALGGLTAEQAGKKVKELPYTIWQLAEHIRIAQWDMLEFSKGEEHKSPKWPDDYWPEETAPADEKAWKHCLDEIRKDLQEFTELVQTGDLYTPFPHGEGQTLLREALQLADHNAYHTAEIIVIRRLLGLWK
jgi:uncharacterized damage-inducible protein DinB